MKKYCDDMIMDKFYALSSPKKVDVLFNALGLMSDCNSQSEAEVIAKSMGFKQVYENNEKYWIKNTEV